jgi:methyltransferase (TIGR00027 family)
MTEAGQHEGLASTAFWTAAARAMENAREDRLIEDPWALLLAGQEGAAWIEQRTPQSVLPIVLRTRFFDDFLRRITAQESIRQIVLMAAGLDTRAFRLAWPAGTRINELDQSPVLHYKEMVLHAAGAEAACWLGAVEADLTASWQGALVEAGFDLQKPSGWLLEGFLFYLPSEILTRLLDEVACLAAPESWLGFDVINSAMLASDLTRPWLEMQARAGAPWISTLEDPEGFLAARGWQAALTQAGADEANHGRWTCPVLPVEMPGVPHNWFVTAKKAGGSLSASGGH